MEDLRLLRGVRSDPAHCDQVALTLDDQEVAARGVEGDLDVRQVRERRRRTFGQR